MENRGAVALATVQQGWKDFLVTHSSLIIIRFVKAHNEPLRAA
jgi:hypothetical protein